MHYRKMGKTGVEVSALGFGCMRLPLENGLRGSREAKDVPVDQSASTAMIRHAIDYGVNYIDTAYGYLNGTSEPVVGNALLDGYRERVNLATKSPIFMYKDEGSFDKLLDEQLRRLQTDHIDFYLLHGINKQFWEECVLKYNALPRMMKAKEDGRIRFMGFSFHDSYDTFKSVIDYTDAWDFCQIQHNYMDMDYQAGTRGLEYAAARGLGVVIMEPLRGGYLADPPEDVQQVLSVADGGERTPVEWGFDYLWDRPEVSAVLSGMFQMAQVDENIAYAGASSVGMLSDAERAALAKAKECFANTGIVPCTECGYCSTCPRGIAIPEIYKTYNRYILGDGLEESRREYLGHTATLGALAGECIGCKTCEDICPQHIETSKNMPVIAELYGR